MELFILLEVNPIIRNILAFISLMFWVFIIRYLFFRKEDYLYEKELQKSLAKKKEEDLPENLYVKKVQNKSINLSRYFFVGHYPYIKIAKPILNYYADRPNSDSEDVKNGRTEFFFYQLLIKSFDVNFITNSFFKIGYYTPDFLYFDPENKIHVAIEIDECYSMSHFDPIHYYKREFDGNVNNKILDSNSKKDDDLNERGWTVVRFSEEQIIFQPNECIELIRWVIKYWDLKYTESKNDINIQIPIVKRWDWNTARLLKVSESREYSFRFIDSYFVGKYYEKEAHRLPKKVHFFPIYKELLTRDNFQKILDEIPTIGLEDINKRIEFQIELIGVISPYKKILVLNLKSRIMLEKFINADFNSYLDSLNGKHIIHSKLEQYKFNLQLEIPIKNSHKLFNSFSVNKWYSGSVMWHISKDKEYIYIDTDTIEEV